MACGPDSRTSKPHPDRPTDRPTDRPKTTKLYSSTNSTQIHQTTARYLIPSGEPVTLVHSYDRRRVPGPDSKKPDGNQDFCEFVNRNTSAARMVYQVRARVRVRRRGVCFMFAFH